MARILATIIAAMSLAAPAVAAPSGADLYLQSLVPEADHASPPSAEAAADPAAQRMAKEIEKRFGVRVLRVERAESGGKPVYRMAVMNAGGDFNNAFAVHTLVVDPASGELLPEFRHEVSGYQPPAPLDRTPRDNGIATTIRRESFTKP